MNGKLAAKIVLIFTGLYAIKYTYEKINPMPDNENEINEVSQADGSDLPAPAK